MSTDSPDPDIDFRSLDFRQVIADADAIRMHNPHRFEMEMLTGIVLIDPAKSLVVGFKDVRHDEFWVRGHMPNYPVFPGVLMVEAAAQLTCYYAKAQKVCDHRLMGLGAIEKARFLRQVVPGDRLVLIGKGVKLHRRLTRFFVRGYVNNEKTFEAEVTGLPIADVLGGAGA